MEFTISCQPRGRNAAVHRTPGLRALVIASLLASGASYAAEPAPGADIASVRAWLLENSPDLRSMQAEAEAAQARVQPAGALPDPMAGIELRGIDPHRPTLLPGNVGTTLYTLKQELPLWGKRELARDAARQQADAARLDRDAAALGLLARVEQVYVRYWHARESVSIIDRQLALLGQMEEVARARYAVGDAAQQDSIRAQVALTVMQGERIRRLAAREEAVAWLNATLGRPADALLAEPESEPALPMPAASLGDALDALDASGHPALQASAALADAADTTARLQRRRRFPGLTVGLGVMQRDDRVDGYEVMLEMAIPLQQRARREREREALYLGDAARARSDAVAATLQGQLGQAWSQARSAGDQRRLIEQTLMPQAQANFESALAGYRVGDVDFGTLLEALEAWQDAHLSRVDARRDELIGAAAVRALLGSVE